MVDRFKLGPNGLWVSRAGEDVSSTDAADFLIMDDREVNQVYMSGSVPMLAAVQTQTGLYRDAEISYYGGSPPSWVVDAYEAFAPAREAGYRSGLAPSLPTLTPVAYFSNGEWVRPLNDANNADTMMPYVAKINHGLGYTPLCKVDNTEFTNIFYQGSTNIRNGRGTYFSWIDDEDLWILNGFYLPTSNPWYVGTFPNVFFDPVINFNVRYIIYKEPVIAR